jgi:NADPH2:quinone reductase
MKSWRFHSVGDIRNLQLEEIPVPEPGAGEALVRLEFAALNPADAYLVKGQYPRAGKPPFAVGRDGCGVVEKAGPDCGVREGERVVVLRSEVGVSREGTLAEYVVVPGESLAPLPEGWSPEEGAAAPLVCLTAWQALVDGGEIAGGKTVLVTGASGGVGTAAVLLAKGFNCRVVALSRSAEKRELLKELGADVVLDSEDPDLVAHAKEALGGGRADIVVENLGGAFLQKSIEMAGMGGRIGVVGLLSGLRSEVEIALIIFKRIRIEGVTVGAYSPGEAQARWGKIVDCLDRVGKRMPVGRVFEMGQAQEAFAYLEKGPWGKVLVRVGG